MPFTASDICKIILAVLLPPLGVFLERGCAADFWINVLLTVLGYIPGIIHALYIILSVDFESLLSFSLVSRQTLPSANRARYHTPFQVQKAASCHWQRALALLDALESNGNEFGQLVRDSYGLTTWFRQLQTSLADQGIDSATAAQTWCRKIVEACRNLQSIDFFCSTVNDFNSFSNAVIRQSPASSPSHPQQTLVHSFSGLRNLSFGSDRLFVIGIDFTNLFEALRRSSVVHLNSLQIMQVGWTLPTGQDPAISRFLLPVRELDILKETTTFASSVRFFPQDNSILEHFELEGNTTADESPNPGPRISALRYSNWTPGAASPSSSPSLSAVLTAHPLLYCKPLVNHRLFSAASHSRAQNGSVVTIPIPQSLPKSSPTEILATILEFTRLQQLHLGTLPTFDQTRYETLKEALEAEGFEARYEILEKEAVGSEEQSEKNESDEENASDSDGSGEEEES
ncbi:hypothetical protein JCM5353_008874 [Sporobolomyces roseus]